jgi:hypothetical protein
MPLTSAERQKLYREKTKTTRLNTPISHEAKKALLALAERQGITQKRALEQALIYTLEHLEHRP